MDTIILASGSPRRREMLQKVKIPFKVIPPQVNEEIFLANASETTVADIARKKVETIVGMFKQESPRWILGADTLVEINSTFLGKPAGIEEAERMIRALSGKKHRVHTGLALLAEKGKPMDIRQCTTEVKFKSMTEHDIHFYMDSGEWTGAAGAYRIQEQGGFFIEWIKGSYSNVVGLPLEILYSMLLENGYIFAGG
ncbi:MAG: septum formation protein Maf [Spirochaetaceae bacterium]|nr:MAG: septum formation protein Maf [Spirochaetaceae bacterium]